MQSVPVQGVEHQHSPRWGVEGCDSAPCRFFFEHSKTTQISSETFITLLGINFTLVIQTSEKYVYFSNNVLVMPCHANLSQKSKYLKTPRKYSVEVKRKVKALKNIK